ncbi:hypothetical protein ACFYT4_31345 [Streptomyces sp. NPDC004609]|uniref:hypothetical protein n=1 Tax=Streptomyces sp. NPDC004609 TaxID=3364704 RepID=UPI0036740257
MGGLRVAAIAGLTPLEELDRDPFLVDTRGQYVLCERWAAEHGHVVTRRLVLHGLRPDHRGLWTDVTAGEIDLFVAAAERVLARALGSVPGFAAECARRGVGLRTTGLDEPVYDAAMKADVHRRLSMPTAGYGGG